VGGWPGEESKGAVGKPEMSGSTADNCGFADLRRVIVTWTALEVRLMGDIESYRLL
jgi:hypothetical protein